MGIFLIFFILLLFGGIFYFLRSKKQVPNVLTSIFGDSPRSTEESNDPPLSDGYYLSNKQIKRHNMHKSDNALLTKLCAADEKRSIPDVRNSLKTVDLKSKLKPRKKGVVSAASPSHDKDKYQKAKYLPPPHYFPEGLIKPLTQSCSLDEKKSSAAKGEPSDSKKVDPNTKKVETSISTNSSPTADGDQGCYGMLSAKRNQLHNVVIPLDEVFEHGVSPMLKETRERLKSVKQLPQRSAEDPEKEEIKQKLMETADKPLSFNYLISLWDRFTEESNE